MATESTSAKKTRTHLIEFTVDGERVTTTMRELTPVQIMQLAGVDPSTHYLKEIRGHRQISYKDHPEDSIRVHDHQRFITNSLEPTPVS